MAKSNLREAPCVAQLRAALEYNPATGALRWRNRPEMPARWNTRYGGREAGTFNSQGRRAVNWGGRIYGAHRLAWLIVTGEWPEEIDHINGDPADNRFANLRAATRSQNNCNRRVRRDSMTGVKGVHRYRNGTYSALLRVGGKMVRLGAYESIEEAKAAYDAAAIRAHGEFASLS